MISVIDTNLLYYLDNISTEQSTYDSTLLLNNLKSDYTEVEVSDLSILEACVAFRNDRIKLIKIFNFIKNNNICINSIFHDEHNFNMKEAATAYIDYLFKECNARRIFAYTEDYNISCQRLLEKLGFRQEGFYKEFVSFVNDADGNPVYENTYEYAILKKEWKMLDN